MPDIGSFWNALLSGLGTAAAGAVGFFLTGFWISASQKAKVAASAVLIGLIISVSIAAYIFVGRRDYASVIGYLTKYEFCEAQGPNVRLRYDAQGGDKIVSIMPFNNTRVEMSVRAVAEKKYRLMLGETYYEYDILDDSILLTATNDPGLGKKNGPIAKWNICGTRH